jgi:hypothetical protein
MRALAEARASAVQQRKERSQTHSKEKHTEQAKAKTTEFTFGSFSNL